MQKIILDTNFLMIPLSLKIDIFREFERICEYDYKLYILDKTICELDNIINNQTLKHKKSAKIAKTLIDKENIGIIKTENDVYVDLQLINIAKNDKNIVIATQDKELKDKLKKENIPIIFLRQKKYLSMEK